MKLKEMEMTADKLRFKWDPHADSGYSVETNKNNTTDRMMSFEEYIDFIEQFTGAGGDRVTDHHVDKIFTLDA